MKTLLIIDASLGLATGYLAKKSPARQQPAPGSR